ncbi:ABC transporter ATP-binding protein [Bifidobacterium sp. SO1]|uniref:ABC transporter ATP-binding protein n=1 Tax=Bifidobacterium sp. SO1 TaxID=2809029 RepID=UPI003204D36C
MTPAGQDGDEVVARAIDLTKTYGDKDSQVVALDHVNVEFMRGQMTAIMGPSGSGKSTLMHCMAGLDQPTSGKVVVEGLEVSSMNQRQLTRLRRDQIGFIFQSFNLVPTLTAEENILLPLQIAKRPIDLDWFNKVVDVVGLRSRLTHRPSQLSGGQQQRVACARAIMARPSVIFADEPTGNLDSHSSREVLGFLKDSVREYGQTIVMVTHDPRAASYADRVLVLADGRITQDLRHPTYDEILEVFAGEGDEAAEDFSAPLRSGRNDNEDSTPSEPSASSRSGESSSLLSRPSAPSSLSSRPSEASGEISSEERA